MSDLRETLRHRAEQADQSLLLAHMGYNRVGESQNDRLTSVVDDPTLGLEGGHFDFVHDSRSFLHALCLALGIPERECQDFIENYERFELERQNAYKPWIWVEVGNEEGGRRAGFFGKWAAGTRQLDLPSDTWQYPFEVQLKMAQIEVQEHMAKTSGNMRAWGRILSYQFHYGPNATLELTPDGSVIEKK